MEIEVRTIAGGIEPAFEAAWNERLARSFHANFTFDLTYQRHAAEHGEPSRLVLVDDGPLRGALVLRESGRELVSGWPWRVQALVEGAEQPEGLDARQAALLFDAARRVAGRHRLRFYSPWGGPGSHPDGGTVMIDLARGEDELLAAMDGDKRRRARKAERDGYRVSQAVEVEAERRFAAIVDEVHVTRHGHRPKAEAGMPAPGEGWRTWERPWHGATFVFRGDDLVGGYGWGWQPGGTLDGRASGATDEARRSGASILMIWETMRHARARGVRWYNPCGQGSFKREFGGTVVPLHCRLGGGIEWLPLNVVENLVQDPGRRAARAILAHIPHARRALAAVRSMDRTHPSPRRTHPTSVRE